MITYEGLQNGHSLAHCERPVCIRRLDWNGAGTPARLRGIPDWFGRQQ
jgi:hypothetical protein